MKSDFVIEDDDEEEEGQEQSQFMESLKLNLSRLIAYADSADIKLQREVAERLANEAVKPARQVQIVEYGGLQLLVPLMKSTDVEVQRLAAHALANLSVNSTNQEIMAKEGAIEMLITMLNSPNELIQRQSAKALANLGVNTENKRLIALAGGIPKLVQLAKSPLCSIKIEAVAALANLAVNDANEVEIVNAGGLEPIIEGATFSASALDLGGRVGAKGDSAAFVGTTEQFEELAAQCARALRNLSVNPSNKDEIVRQGAAATLSLLINSMNERVAQQARRALKNIESSMVADGGAAGGNSRERECKRSDAAGGDSKGAK